MLPHLFSNLPASNVLNNKNNAKKFLSAEHSKTLVGTRNPVILKQGSLSKQYKEILIELLEFILRSAGNSKTGRVT